MGWISLIFVGLAVVLWIVSYIWMIVAAFRVSLLWGLLVFFFPGIMPLMFLLVHWEDAKRPFFCNLLALTALVPAIFLNWDVSRNTVEEFMNGVLKKHGQTVHETPQAVLARKEAELIEHANEMNAKYAGLMARQATLATADEATKAAFEADAAAYAALRKQVEAEKAEVDALKKTSNQ